MAAQPSEEKIQHRENGTYGFYWMNYRLIPACKCPGYYCVCVCVCSFSEALGRLMPVCDLQAVSLLLVTDSVEHFTLSLPPRDACINTNTPTIIRRNPHTEIQE